MKLSQDRARMRQVAVASRAQRHQLLLQRSQGLQSLPHTVDVLVKKRVHLCAGLVRLRCELEQLADLGQRNVERSAVADELQALQMMLRVAAIARVLAFRLLEQSLSFVEPHRLNVAACLGRQLADLHHIPPTA
jgi:hypothetical protein